jgi:probable addiction module antidote protein
LEDGGTEEFLYALRDVAIANGGVQDVALKSRHGRESLYKSLSKEGNPRIKTLDDVLHAMGMRISVARYQPTADGTERAVTATA